MTMSVFAILSVHSIMAMTSTLQSGVPAESVQATRGINGEVVIEVEGDSISPRSDLDLDSPMLVRIAGSRELDGDRMEYRLQFIGVDVGFFDLREVLETEDGSRPDHLPPIPVEVVTNLADDQTTDVYVNQEPGRPLSGGYRLFLWALGSIWIMIPVLAFVQHRRGTRDEPESEDPPASSFADQLRPLVLAAARRDLSVAERGRLELLLYAHWQDQLDLRDLDRPLAVARLRRDERAGALLRAIEAWLHRPDSHPTRTTPDEIDELLAPYRQAAPIEMESAS